MKYTRQKRRTLTADVPTSEIVPIPGYPGYFAYRDGRVFSIANMTPYEFHDGYMRVSLIKDDGVKISRKNLGVHQAMALAYLGPQPSKGMVVCHKDGDKKNNVPENLYWGTHKMNSLDMVAHGKSQRGEKSKSAKLTAEQVLEIRRRRADGEKIESIAASFPIVKLITIKLVIYRKTWRHI